MDEKDGHNLKLFKFNAMQQSTILLSKKKAVGSKHLNDYTLLKFYFHQEKLNVGHF